MKKFFYITLLLQFISNLTASEYSYKEAYLDDANWPSHVYLNSKLDLPSGDPPLEPGMRVTLVGAKENGLLLIVGDFKSQWVPHEVTDFIAYYAKSKSSSKTEHRPLGNGLISQLARRSFCYHLDPQRALSEARLNDLDLFILSSHGLAVLKEKEMMETINSVAEIHKNLGLVVAAEEIIPKSEFYKLCESELSHTIVLLPVFSLGFQAALLEGRGPVDGKFMLFKRSGKLLFQSDDLSEIIEFADKINK